MGVKFYWNSLMIVPSDFIINSWLLIHFSSVNFFFFVILRSNTNYFSEPWKSRTYKWRIIILQKEGSYCFLQNNKERLFNYGESYRFTRPPFCFPPVQDIGGQHREELFYVLLILTRTPSQNNQGEGKTPVCPFADVETDGIETTRDKSGFSLFYLLIRLLLGEAKWKSASSSKKDESSFLSIEALFYIGLAIFLYINERVQMPCLQSSPHSGVSSRASESEATCHLLFSQ